MNLIEINPEVRFGQPILKGTRIAVEEVLNWLNTGMSIHDIRMNYSELTAQQIDACLVFAAAKELKMQISE